MLPSGLKFAAFAWEALNMNLDIPNTGEYALRVRSRKNLGIEEVRRDIREHGKFSYRLRLPAVSADLSRPVKAWQQDVEIETYAPEIPDRNPMILEKRVYQGSSGQVYSLPFSDRVTVKKISDMTLLERACTPVYGRKYSGTEPSAPEYEHSLELEILELEIMEPKIDYFATSLPAMLLSKEDLQRRNAIEARYLRAQSYAGLGKVQEGELLLQVVLTMDASHAGASDLLRQILMPKATFRAV